MVEVWKTDGQLDEMVNEKYPENLLKKTDRI
jgi:hypothetical protein